jgi:hypothetical protein
MKKAPRCCDKPMRLAAHSGGDWSYGWPLFQCETCGNVSRTSWTELEIVYEVKT